MTDRNITQTAWWRHQSWFDHLFRFLVVGLWITSLTLPAAWSHDDTGQWNHYDGPIYGWEILLFGWVEVFELQFGWFANLLVFPALFVPGKAPSPQRWRGSLYLAIALALCFAGGLMFTRNEASFGPEWNTPYGMGRVLWLVAIGAASGRLAMLLWLKRSRPSLDPLFS